MLVRLCSSLCDDWDCLSCALMATTEKNLKGITVDRERCAEFLHSSVGLATLLNTHIGYTKAAEIAKESEKSGKPVRDIVEERGLMDVEDFDAIVLKAARDGIVE